MAPLQRSFQLPWGAGTNPYTESSSGCWASGTMCRTQPVTPDLLRVRLCQAQGCAISGSALRHCTLHRILQRRASASAVTSVLRHASVSTVGATSVHCPVSTVGASSVHCPVSTVGASSVHCPVFTVGASSGVGRPRPDGDQWPAGAGRHPDVQRRVPCRSRPGQITLPGPAGGLTGGPPCFSGQC